MSPDKFDMTWDDADADLDEPFVDHRIEEETNTVRLRRHRHEYCTTAGKDRPEMCDVPFPLCPACDGSNYQCWQCNGVGYINVPISDEECAEYLPGSQAAVVIKSSRYVQGMSLWTGQPIVNDN